MPLNLEPKNNDFTPYMKFNGKAGRWYSKNESGEEFEVANMTAIFDLANIKTGWILFTEGAAPDQVWDNGTMAAQPSPKHKRGFSVNAFSPKELGGLRELSATSNVSIVAIRELYDDWEMAPESKKGLVPVVKCTGVVPVKGKFSTNYQPVLKIERWVPRPEAMGDKSNAAPAAHAADASVPPPIAPAAAASAAAASDSEEF